MPNNPAAVLSTLYPDHGATTSTPPPAPSKLKRPASDDFEQEQRMTKRMQLLDLSGANEKLWIPANTSRLPSNTIATPIATAPSQPPAPPSSPVQGVDLSDYGNMDDMMQVEDSAHRIYIHSLDAEIASLAAEAASEEERIIFLPDVERKLSKIPQHVLTGRRPSVEDDLDMTHLATGPQDGQLVLYSVPKSLTVPEDRDGVRRAIIESRARAREKEHEDHLAMELERPTTPMNGIPPQDEDAMEVEL